MKKNWKQKDKELRRKEEKDWKHYAPKERSLQDFSMAEKLMAAGFSLKK